MSSEEEKTLVKKRGSLKSKVTIFSNYIVRLKQKFGPDESTGLSDQEIYELQDRLDKARIVYQEFDEIQTQLELLSDNEEIQYKERESFEEMYHGVISAAKCFLKVPMLAEREQTSSNNSIRSGSHSSIVPVAGNVVAAGSIVAASPNNHVRPVKLPDIKLPTFSGNYNNWLEYRDTYTSLIHSRTDMDEVQKFHYLRASLEGSASQVIKSIELSAQNYELAFDLLCKRFNNKNILIKNHLDALFNIEKIAKCSAYKLRNLSDSISKHLRALKVLEQNIESWDVIIIHLVTKSLDSQSLAKWEEFKSLKDNVTLETMYEFLENYASLLEQLEGSTTQNNFDYSKKDQKHFQSKNRSLVTADNTYYNSYKCSFCAGAHKNHECEKFKNFNVEKRIEETKNNKLCLNCLRPGHFSKQCRLQGSCKTCNSKHNTLLHNTKQVQKEHQIQQSSPKPNDNVALAASHSSLTLLSTVLVQVYDKNNSLQQVRALLDSGSMSSFISQSLCEKLELGLQEINFAVSGLSNQINKIKYKTNLDIYSRFNHFITSLSCLVLPEITSNLPTCKINTNNLNIPQNIKLADPLFHKPGPIDLLIGADAFWQLLSIGHINLGQDKPILQKTKLGWIISGKVEGHATCGKNICHFSQNMENSIQNQLLKFFELEEVSEKSPWSQEESSCELHFIKTTKRLDDGRFEVTIPFKESCEKLGNSIDQAKNRFFALERKLNKNSDLKTNYANFLEDYERLGHMTEISKDINSLDANTSKSISFFLPHHGVFREQSLTSKCRVVFDASAPTTSGLSLNDIQMTGPTIQDDLVSILLRFRQHTYVISADIEKMYRQVSVSPSQRCLQQILWRSNPTDNLKVYILNTITYGMAASPFMAIRCLTELANQCESESPFISEIIKHDFYVDDLLTGCSDIGVAKSLCTSISSILQSGCFPLRKWRSNKPEVLEGLKTENITSECKYLEFGEAENIKTLGLMWCSKTDKLLFNINIENKTKHVTKRLMLSCISKIFDPLGLLSPCVIQAKIMVQQLWQEKLTWDESVPPKLHYSWIRFIDELALINELEIERNIICSNPIKIEIHCFSDSSELAYGSCIYIRSVNEEGDIYCGLLCAKSKVAPIKPSTIPRLELCAAFVLSKLYKKVKESLRLKIDKTHFWTDSKVVLGWIKTSAHLLKPFVRNRVIEIQELTEVTDWHYVPSADNPADLLSRGLNPSLIKTSTLWWQGPSWLRKNENYWPSDNSINCDLPELKPNEQCFISTKRNLEFPFDNFSKLTKLKRCCAFILRFKNNCMIQKKERQPGPLTVDEIDNAFTKLIIISQQTSFPFDYDDLSQKRPLSKKSKILSLNPFIDNRGLIRVGGRLGNSEFSFEKKYPILLSSKHKLTQLICEHEHVILLHAGPQQLLASVRERFWPVSARNLVKSVVHKCIKCYRFKATNAQPIMGDLPANRFLSGFPFQVTGTDYAGPLFIKEKRGRGAKLIKSYICIFICFSTKCVHLELVSDLSSETFLLALKRFIGRRGKPLHIYSDNGSNFVKANKELQELGNFLLSNHEIMQESISSQGINWHFIPAYAPNFGGLWEAGVKCTKHHLKRVMGNSFLTFEEMTTLLVQIEAILNSRPLSPLSADPIDPYPLTPAHFAIGRPLTAILEPNLEDIPEPRLSRYQRIEQLRQSFWSRWQKDYIAELQQRTKWKSNYNTLQKDAMVLIKDDHLSPLEWRLGRVVQFFPGKDKVNRVAEIRTSTGTIKRAFSKLCPLPLQN